MPGPDAADVRASRTSATRASAGRRRRGFRGAHRRLAVLAAAVLMVGGTLTGCGNSPANPKPAGAAVEPPPVGIELANRLLQEYAAGNTRVNAGLDPAAVDAIEMPPASVGSKAGLQVAKTQAVAVPSTGYVQPRFVFPRLTGYPKYFVAITQLLQSSTVSPSPKYLLFVQDQEGAPWKVAYYPFALDRSELPELEQDAAGGAPVVADTAGLLADPAALGRAYQDYAQGKRDPKVPLSPTKALTGQLTGGWTAGVQAQRAKGGILERTIPADAPRYATYLLRTRDGGVLAFTAVQVRDTMTATGGKGDVQLDAGSREAALAGSPEGARAPQFTVDRLEIYLSHIPPSATPGTGVQLIAFGDYALSVT
ncbi:hypothetical protein [Streptomyces sp. SID3343]|uniref:hypothetical protein n=1 Tax=Streptomyces sp. SID3343 TaxID=2690260 RepID=UPI0013694D49|nr:hypothetical protein [Streptomyces sp. SID3343]MYW05540.1 hypothetical protein [Streptomyces sp. SID3343]